MYIQITTRCNMLCEHCCFSCTAQGEDMSEHTFERTLDYAEEVGESLFTIGGGEPTVHPQMRRFFEILERRGYWGEADDHDCGWVHVITNGKKVADALFLAKLAYQGKISANLSLDPWHDTISQRVIDCFTKPNVEAWDWITEFGERYYVRDDYIDRRGINNGAAKYGVDLIGRAAESNQVWPNSYRQGFLHRLCCSGPFIKPDGTIQVCSCNDHPKEWNIHGIHPSEEIQKWTRDGYCYHELEELKEKDAA